MASIPSQVTWDVLLIVTVGNIVSVILPVEVVTEVLPVLDVNVVTLLRVEVSVTVVVGS